MTRTTTLALLGLAGLLAMPAATQARYRDGMSLYQYVQSDPANGVDPQGRITMFVHGYGGMQDQRLRGRGWYQTTAEPAFRGEGRDEVLVGWHWNAGILPNGCQPAGGTPDPQAWRDEYWRQWPAWAPSHFRERYRNALGRESDTLRDFVRDLRQFMDVAGFDDEPINVVGHSLGGALIIAAAQKGAPFDNMSLLQAGYNRNDFRNPMPNVRGNITNNWSYIDGVIAFMFNPIIGHKGLGNTSKATDNNYMPQNLVGTGRVQGYRTGMHHNDVINGGRARVLFRDEIVDQVGGGNWTSPLWAALHNANPVGPQAVFLSRTAPLVSQWIRIDNNAAILRSQ